jgi:hypothetical protein
LQAAEGLNSAEQEALVQWQQQLEQARYQAQLAQRRYHNVDPDNRLVARGLEAAWEAALQRVHSAEQEVQRRQQHPLQALSAAEREDILSLAEDLEAVWSAPSTSDRDRKELLRALLEEVIVTHESEAHQVHLTLRWNGGLISDIDVALPRRAATVCTQEETIALIRRLAVHYPDAIIAGVLNRQQRITATGLPFTVNRVSSLRTHWGIPWLYSSSGARHRRAADDPRGRYRPWCGPIDVAPPAQRRIHRGGASDTGRALAHRDHRGVARTLRRRGSRRLCAHRRRHASARRLTPDPVATCQARGARCHPCLTRQP